MNLYLVQHAEAKPKEVDPDRSLSEKGRADISKVAVYVANYAPIQPDQIVHSGKTRARQTAEVLAEALHLPEGISAGPDLAPLDAPALWGERLAGSGQDVMLVGHLPHLSKLAAWLVCQDETRKVVDFQNAGVVCLGRDEAGHWSVQWIVTPQIVA